MRHPFITVLMLSLLYGTAVRPEALNSMGSAQELLEKFRARDFASDADLMNAVNVLSEGGQQTIDVLAKALLRATDEQAKIDITYLMGLTLNRAELMGANGKLSLAQETTDSLAQMMNEASDPQLQANLVNIAAMLGPKAGPMIHGLIVILGKTSDPGLRATAQYALQASGKGSLTMLHQQIRETRDERVRGDIAQLLRGTPIPADILAVLRDLLNSDQPPVRTQAYRTLVESSLGKGEKLRMTLSYLERTDDDTDRLEATYELEKLDPPNNVAVQALADAFAAYKTESKDASRMDIARRLVARGPDGVHAAVRLLDTVTLNTSRDVLVQVLARQPTDDPMVIDALVAIVATSDDNQRAKEAMFGLAAIGKPALSAVEKALRSNPPAAAKDRLQFTRMQILARKA